MMESVMYVKSIRYPFRAQLFKQDYGFCDACGHHVGFEYTDVISDELAKDWNIDKKLQKKFSLRESMVCPDCGCSARLRALARTLNLIYSKGSNSLRAGIESGNFENYDIAEINACGKLHDILKYIPNLTYSEYCPQDSSVSKQDLQKLDYKNNQFDLLLTSDTLEHVPDYNKAFAEIYRVLKTGGYHIFTIPVIFSRVSKRKIKLEHGKAYTIEKPSYHGSGENDNLVATEFGSDIMKILKQIGFQTRIYFGNPFNKNEINIVLVSKKCRNTL